MMKTLSRTGTAKSDFNWIPLARSGRGAGCRKELHEGITHSLPHLTLRIIRWASQSLPLTCLEPLVALPICLPVPLVPLAPWSPQVKSTKPLHSRHTCCPFCPGCPPSQSCSLFQAQLRYSSSRKLPRLQRGRPPERRTVLCVHSSAAFIRLCYNCSWSILIPPWYVKARALRWAEFQPPWPSPPGIMPMNMLCYEAKKTLQM